MKVLIIEDEPLAAERLKELILSYEAHIEILTVLDSVESSIQWLKSHPHPDLIFLDIQLADGLSFDIFNQVEPKAPIIFTTAYDEYALQAFKVNSIDYLLKPIDEEELGKSIDKYVRLYARQERALTLEEEQIQALLGSLRRTDSFKKRFVVKKGEHLLSIAVEDVLYFYSEDKVCLMRTNDQRRYVIDNILGDLETQLDPEKFFRLNRKYIACHEAITDIISYSNSRLKVRLKHADDEDIVISKQKVKAFKEWLGQ